MAETTEGQGGDVNKGVNGGQYNNDDNQLMSGGVTWPCEPATATGQFMASIPKTDTPSTGSQTAITDLGGGNRGTSR